MPENLESIKELAARIARLANEGAYEGEREAAARKLDILLKKHGLTLDDIADDKRETCYMLIDEKEKFWMKLAVQIMARYFPHSKLDIYEGGDAEITARLKKYKGNILFFGQFTKAEYIEAKDIYLHYRDDYTKQRDDFYKGYVQLQGLGVKGDGTEKETTPKEREELRRIMKKMQGIDHTFHQKKLAGGTGPAIQ